MKPATSARQRGFASLEILAAVTVVAITLLSIATMYLTAHASVERAGDATIAVGMARQILEDMGSLPYDNLVELDGFDTDNPSTLPTNDPEREIARRWRYAVSGVDAGWSVSPSELAAWTTYADQAPGLAGTIDVTSPSGSLRVLTVTMSSPNRPADIRIATQISRTVP